MGKYPKYRTSPDVMAEIEYALSDKPVYPAVAANLDAYRAALEEYYDTRTRSSFADAARHHPPVNSDILDKLIGKIEDKRREGPWRTNTPKI